MPDQEIEIRSTRTSLFLLLAVISAGALYASTGSALFSDKSHDHDDHPHEHGEAAFSEETLRNQFNVLQEKSTNSCGAQPQHLEEIPEGQRMQGSCCAAMTFHSYKEQVTGLKKHYADTEIIPSDPYNISVKWAKQMIEYNDATELTKEQQTVYDKAVERSHEDGPCCCKCWHWYAYNGLGKKLIIEHDFTAEQVAEVWDFSDACGGSHTHS